MDEHENKSSPTPEGQPPAEGEEPALHAEAAAAELSVPATAKLADNDPVALNPEPLAAPVVPVEAPSVSISPSIRLDKKHPLAIRWMHWINFPVLFTMIWSGLLIYWNDSDNAYKHPHAVYRIGLGPFTLFRFFPPWFWKAMNAPYHVTKGLGYHFFFMWLFAINGILYVLYTIVIRGVALRGA